MKTVRAVKLALVLALGIVLGDSLTSLNPLIIWSAALGVILLAFLILKSPWSTPGAYLALFLVGLLLGHLIRPPLDQREDWPSAPVFLGGKVLSEAYRQPDRLVSVFRSDWISVDGASRRSYTGKFRLITSSKEAGLTPGSRLILFGEPELYPEKRNPGGRDLRQEFWRRGIVGWIKPTEIISTQAVEPGAAARARSAIAGIFSDSLPPRQAGLLTGMILGDKSALPEDIKDDFRRSGLYHLLAVSGLHVGYLFAVLMLIINPLSLNLRLRRIALMIGLWGYVVLTGANPPTLRAALMISLVLLSYEVQRVPRHWNLWGAAAFLILLISPYQLFQPGFQLSFAAMAGVLVALDVKKVREIALPIYPVKSIRLRRFAEDYVTLPLLVSACAVIFTAPVLVAHFGGFAPIAVLLNLVAVPLAGAIFGLAWALILLHMILGSAVSALAGALELGLKSLEALAQVGAHLPGNAYGSYGGFLAAIALVVVLLGVLLSANWKRKILWLAAGLAFYVLLPLAQFSPHLRIECFDVGQGDAILLRFPGGSTLMVDGGDEEAATFELVPLLRKRGIHRLNNLLITHFDVDHAGGSGRLMESLKVDRLLTNSLQPESRLGRDIFETARRRRIPVRQLSLGDTIADYPGACCCVLWPPQSTGGDENRESIVLKISYGQTDILLTGDIGSEEEKIILAAGDVLQSEMLKVAHHGSRFSSRREFLEQVSPEVALISCGGNNPYGHPAARVLEDLEDLGTEIHRTDLSHAAVFASDGESLWPVLWR